ncbi:hypothetical protein FIV42_04710 [Persicimonas caeni]|uniref:Disintegrin domain-containing protein n=1 Tax=Persicimonas caeni TaxID=2292766 RepID=A0A4Y6PNZ9_PERCE|nr:putative metal-binding motif-containing protein [Persicimonas caeni]QDG50061.1 hypothetical protein FIV42_04710 [Persicimonas caeni]QED31282.1 hypothetical protein FRD00_04705 [Persicimonas caeni]
MIASKNRFWLLNLLFATVVAFSGCGSCDDTSGNTTNNTTTQADGGDVSGCDDGDSDGFGAGETCEEEQIDCDDSDSAINPGADEVCGDGVDNNCDGQIDEDCESCTDGETRQCGSDVGACQMGTQTCNDGTWSECEGEVRSAPETCDGVDNDCDGEVDEDPQQTLCNDGIKCNGAEVCQAGTCVDSEPVDCSHLDEPCFKGVCLEKDGSCSQQMIADGTTCDDGNFCTIDGVCQQGVCETSPRDCSGESDQCNTGVCDEDADACVPQPVSDGTTCDDGAFCTVGDSCQAGTCEGSTRDCSGSGDQCNDGICDEQADSCVPQPVSDGTACDDGAYCTVGDTCQAGQCNAGAPRQCGASGGSCRTGVCDEQNDTCDGDPVADGTPCDDGQFCTVSDSCSAGTCVGGSPKDCSGAGDQCNDGVCDESNNRCRATPKPDGTTCDDGAFCTVSDACTSGACGGTSRDCSSAGDQCNEGICDESNDSCAPRPLSDGTTCDDGAFCTVGDTCSAGSCGGAPRNCSNFADECNAGACDEQADSCYADPFQDGTTCDDGLFCTVGDTCTAGVCDGSARDCSGVVTTQCGVGVCEDNFDRCVEQNDPTCCDSTVDNDLDGVSQCNDCDDTNGGVYPGATETCNGIDDDCDGAIDEDFDADGDGYATCSDDPLIRDCDDSNANVNPGMDEDCGANDQGNGIDDDCDGYVDEGCNPCTTTDADNDGYSECDGDCDDSNPDVHPGATEQCDGLDNDCNTFTTKNCDVDEPCNFNSGTDVCMNDRICACIVDNSGSCTGDYRCTTYCNWSETGPIGDGCGADQTCLYDMLRSSNVHACGVTTDTPGVKGGGEACGSDSECRSLNCDRICRGPGCNQDYCQDYCGSDDYCGTNAVCRLSRLSDNIDGRCWPSGGPLLGSSSIGQSCSSDTSCDRGLCMTDPNDSSRYCTGACCKDSDCPSGYTCTMGGDQIDTTYVYPDPRGITCTTDSDCSGSGGICYNNECAWRLVETSPMCVKDVSGQGSRVAGQQCAQNSDCESNFCEKTLGVCVSTCCNDAACPTGLTCEGQTVQTDTDRVSQVRVCINVSTENVLERK